MAEFFVKCEMFQVNIVEKIETNIFCSIILLLKIVPFLMWKNMVEPDRLQMTNGRMRFACWITKAKHKTNKQTHTDIILIAFP